ncbi:MAG: F0F1 ATP synthase subunit A [Anaerohalosphaera sp.]|nr:F0F1 ATP synthase subunit A [Anaerohalosphaera sp.]
MNSILANMNLLEEIASKTLFNWGAFRFTNHMLMILMASIALLVVLPLSIRRKALVPHGFGNMIEAICMFLREEVARPFLHDRTDKYISYLWTMFFFILTMNLLGMIPFNYIIYLFTRREVHLIGAATANIWVTSALAFFSFSLFHVAGIHEQGFFTYFKNLSPRVPWPLMPFMFCMELLSTFVRMFSLAVRLFANILAGHLLLFVLINLILMFKNPAAGVGSVIGYVLMSLLEVFVAFLQSYIFTFLTAIFIGFAVQPEH